MTVHVGREATADAIATEAPDVIVIATGARPVVPDVVSDGSVVLASGLADVPAKLADRHVLVVDEDGHYWAAQVAEEIARRGASVTVMTRYFEAFRELPVVSRIAALRALDLAGTTVLATHEIVRVRDGGVDARHYESHRPARLDHVDLVVWVGPQVPRDELVAALAERLPDVDTRVIGDAFAPRRMRNAIREGFDLAWSLD